MTGSKLRIILEAHPAFKDLLVMSYLLRTHSFLLFCFSFWICTPQLLIAQASKEQFVVVLDAGHGGKDSGNRGNGYYEKHIALNITLAIGKILENSSGFKVIYTRKKDSLIALNHRAKIANEADADLFVSIHCDAFQSPKAYGAGTFVLGLHRSKDNFRIAQKENSVIFLEEDYQVTYDGFDPNNPESVISLVLMQEAYLNQSIEAASAIQKSFVDNLDRKDRTVKQAGFLVLRETYMPSVLVEVGFLTNPKEGEFLNSKKGQAQMAQSIAKAISNYRNRLKATVGEELVVQTPEQKKPSAQANLSARSNQSKSEEEVEFKVQIAASSKKLALVPENFKGLSPITMTSQGSLYRYYFGGTPSFKTAEKLKKRARRKGYPNAFLVAFREGKKIKISEAISD